MPHHSAKQWSIRRMLLLPVIVIAVVTIGLLTTLDWISERAQFEALLSRRADSVLDGMTERLREREQAKRVYAQLLADTPGLASAVARQDVAGIAQALVPLKTRLGLMVVQVAAKDERLLLTLGGGPPAHRHLIHDALTGLSPTHNGVRDGGIEIFASAPIKNANGIVGALIVGNVLDHAALRNVRDRSSVDLAVVNDGRVAVTTLEPDSPHMHALEQIAALVGSAAPDSAPQLESHRVVMRAMSEEGILLGLIPTDDIVAASRQRGLAALVGSLCMAGGLAAMGYLLASRIGRPLQAMRVVTNDLVSGRYDRRVTPTNIAELHDLGEAVNHLASQIEDQLAQLTHQALYDKLSGLPNRALLTERLGHALVRAQRRETHVALLFLDLDNFKVINDSLGHQAGDNLIIGVAERLRNCLRPEDTAARLGGDEFIVLLEDIRDAADATAVAGRFLDHLRAPFMVDGHEVFASASVGIATSTHDDTASDLLRKADLAMYHAKNGGKARYAVYDRIMNDQALERLAIENDLRRAVDGSQLRLVYQPLVDLTTGQLNEVEALVRWDHPTRGVISPVHFIPIAEETGLILPIGRWVLREACRQAHAWLSQHPSARFVVSVNLSARQFQSPSLTDEIEAALAASGLTADRLKLEVTETVMMHDVDAAVATLGRLRDLGIRVAIDDFGTGYSSLAQLRRIPVDVLKIDRAFVSRLSDSTEDQAIVRSIIDLARTLNLHVTGEGIETVEQLRHLQALGCEQGQGYFFSEPATADAVTTLLSGNATFTLGAPLAPHLTGMAARVAAA